MGSSFQRFAQVQDEIREVADAGGIETWEAAPLWYARTRFGPDAAIVRLDAKGDGGCDMLVRVGRDATQHTYMIISKFSATRGRTPVNAYAQLKDVMRAVDDHDARARLRAQVRAEVEPRLDEVMRAIDAGRGTILFLSTGGPNLPQFEEYLERMDFEAVHEPEIVHLLIEREYGSTPTPLPIRIEYRTCLPNETADRITYDGSVRADDLLAYIRADDDFRYSTDNVREHLGKTKVNKALSLALRSPDTFHSKNSGVTIVARGLIKGDGSWAQLRHATVVDGGQTLQALLKGPGAVVSGDIRLSVKVIVLRADPMVDADDAARDLREKTNELAITHNSRNPIKDYQLHANDDREKQTERAFAARGLFYERRKGAAVTHKGRIEARGLRITGAGLLIQAQTDACYLHAVSLVKKTKLEVGCWKAYGNGGALFHQDTHVVIRRVPVALRPLLWEVYSRVLAAIEASSPDNTPEEFKEYGRFAVFTLFLSGLHDLRGDAQDDARALVECSIDPVVVAAATGIVLKAWRDEDHAAGDGKQVSLNNFFKATKPLKTRFPEMTVAYARARRKLKVAAARAERQVDAPTGGPAAVVEAGERQEPVAA